MAEPQRVASTTAENTTKQKQNMSGDFNVTHQAPFNIVVVFFSPVACFVFVFCDERTDTMCENNHHLYG